MDRKFRVKGPLDCDRVERTGITVEQVADSAVALNGRDKTSMVIKQDDESAPYLAIGGGSEGRFVVFMSLEGHWVRHVVNGNIPKNAEEIRIVCGGQRSDMDAHYIVDKSAMLEAVRQFCQDGTQAEKLIWESL